MNTIKIVYPGEFVTVFTIESDNCHSNILERIFAEWNNGSGYECKLFNDSKIRSLSVNDFVCIDDNWYQCASIGWRPVTQKFVDLIENKINNHPDFKEMWFTF